MPSIDTVIAGGGVSGLLIASALASECSVLLIEQSNSIPENKYWLTNRVVASENPHLENCIDRYYDSIDFIAYDGLVATVAGSYCLWDTERLVSKLTEKILSRGGQILTGHRLYSLSNTRNGIVIRANSKAIHARLLIDCMGFGSPIVAVNLQVHPMLGFKGFGNAEIAISGIELSHKIKKGQSDTSSLALSKERAPQIWEAVMAA